MKKIYIILGAFFCIGLFAIGSMTFNQSTVLQDGTEWVRAENDFWVGKEETLYKIGTDKILMLSKDGGKQWELVADGVWQGLTDNWYKFEHGQLFVSTDVAKTWSPVTDNKWEATDGNWHMLDSKGKLWVRKPKPVS